MTNILNNTCTYFCIIITKNYTYLGFPEMIICNCFLKLTDAYYFHSGDPHYSIKTGEDCVIESINKSNLTYINISNIIEILPWDYEKPILGEDTNDTTSV